MDERTAFYAQRDPRSVEILGSSEPLVHPVRVVIGPDAAETTAGQFAAASLIEMIARLHRRVLIDCPDVPADLPYQTDRSSLPDLLVAAATRIDPYGVFEVGRASPDLPVIGLGETPGVAWKLSILGATGVLDQEAHGITDEPASALGAGAVACQGAAALLHLVANRTVRAASMSPWDLREPGAVRTGPSEIGTLDVGDVAVIGGGAVAAGLAWWLQLFQRRGHWAVVDRDTVALHNTNRSLGFLPWHAGWPDREPEGKADLVAGMLHATPHRCWYHEWKPDRKYDLVLPLANQHDVRHHIGQHGLPIVVHATTGRDWEAQLHRHIPGRDGCIDCRFADLRPASFVCSTGINPPNRERRTDATDAALPFLSAGAGLLLACALLRLSETDRWDEEANWWGWRFLGGRTTIRTSVASCRPSCRQQLPEAAVCELNAEHRLAGLLSP